MQRIIAGLTVVLAAGLLVASADAQLLTDVAGKAEDGQIETGGAFCFSETDYDSGDLNDPSVKRLTVGAYAAYGLMEWIDVFGSAGYIINAEPDDWSGSGSGFIVAGGARSAGFDLDPITVRGFGQLGYISEDYGSSNVQGVGDADGEATILEFLIGALAEYAANDELSFFGGLEIVPWSDGTVDTKGRGWSRDFDIERDNRFGIRAGGRYRFDAWWVRAEVTLIDEMAFTAGGGIAF